MSSNKKIIDRWAFPERHYLLSLAGENTLTNQGREDLFSTNQVQTTTALTELFPRLTATLFALCPLIG